MIAPLRAQITRSAAVTRACLVFYIDEQDEQDADNAGLGDLRARCSGHRAFR